MTLLVKGVRFYLRCQYGHRFERAKPDSLVWCPKCGGKVWCYGLKDTTFGDETPLPETPPDQPDTSAH